jgi:hypothetical protein
LIQVKKLRKRKETKNLKKKFLKQNIFGFQEKKSFSLTKKRSSSIKILLIKHGNFMAEPDFCMEKDMCQPPSQSQELDLCLKRVLVYPDHSSSRVLVPNRLLMAYVPVEVSYLVEQLPHCNLLRLILLTE